METLAMTGQQRKRHCCIINNNNMNNRNKSTFTFSLMSLPKEILIDIFLRLPVSSICGIRCVCKSMLNIVDCPRFGTLHTQRLLTAELDSISNNMARQVPHQLMQINNYGNFSFHSVKYDGNIALIQKEDAIVTEFRPPNPQWGGYQLAFVFRNLLCFTVSAWPEWEWPRQPARDSVKYEEPCILVNPLKGEVLMLPTTTNAQIPTSCPVNRVLDWLAMGFDNATKHLKIVRVSGNKDEHGSQLVAQVHVLGTSSWREIDSVPPSNLSHYKKAYVYGEMHWLVWLDLEDDSQALIRKWTIGISSFDFKKEEFHQRIHPPTYLRGMYGDTITTYKYNLHSRCHLVNLRGCMTMADTSSPYNIKIWMLKNYQQGENNKEWTLQYEVRTTCVSSWGNPFYAGVENLNCYEWERGIFFNESGYCTTVFLDVTTSSMSRVRLFPFRGPTSTFSYTATFISLKHYGTLVSLLTPKCSFGIVYFN